MSADTSSDTVTPALLRGHTQDLESDPLDAPEALKRVWSGLCLARLLGLRLACTDQGWRRRQANAESLEHQLAHDLGTSATFADTELRLPEDGSPRPLPRHEVEEAVVALVGFSATARRRMLAAAPLAREWHDERVLRHDSKVMGGLAEAWLGNRAGYRVERR
ncbi:hypothetical protein [Saccharothrix syringae]|uniref:Uncharacterized protein n=1 Tax=Saccharothrix syringae TaxID=103733 RepID=A0A5Q0H8W4_SACSY|nr:hypothetical protein [Saccharothrix syringae]QFZ22668.1 hypothetical protein EKG83_39250 [Saccharothrix syringae]